MSLGYHSDIFDRFKKTFEADKAQYIQPWMVKWDYQDKRTKRQVSYEGELPEDFYTYTGPQDLFQWLNWQLSVVKPDYFDPKRVAELSAKSKAFDQKLVEEHNIPVDLTNYDACIGSNNAQDFILGNLYPHPGEGNPLKVLDFGAGYGRQANLWTQAHPGITYVAMDAIPKPYCLQHLYFSNSDQFRADYAIDPQGFSIGEESGIYHLPTWRHDLLPSGYFDKVVIVQVLQELNARLVKEMIKVFHRILKPNGSIYIRDHDQAWRPTHKMDVNQILQESGFTLEYRGHLVDKKDLHGIPRIWRKTNPAVLERQKVSSKQRVDEFVKDFDSATGGQVKKVIKKILKK